jgi:hypothetical protein
MTDTTASQRDQILDYLKQGYELTPLDALVRFKCLRLSGRILELRQAGYDIQTNDRVLTAESGKKKRVAAYRLNRGTNQC